MTDVPEGRSPRVLIVEDEADLRDAMVDYLRMEGMTAAGAGTLGAAEHWLGNHDCDVLVLDLGLPDGDGLAWLAAHPEQLRRGVVVTTARGHSGDRVAGARAGADAYLVKPVVLEELASLIGNLMRRLPPSTSPPPPSWALDTLTWRLCAPGGVWIKLTRSEFELMRAVLGRPGQAVARAALIVALGHDPSYYDTRRLETMVRRLRTKVAEVVPGGLPLDTVHAYGYAFTAPVEIQPETKAFEIGPPGPGR